jgi:very-short-patch-repair endonuclease
VVIGMGSLHNGTHLKENRKDLRNNLTTAEATLWTFLQRRQLEGRKFRRQHSIGNYIVDFYCPQERLAVELDGEYHFIQNGFAEDELRDVYPEELNI